MVTKDAEMGVGGVPVELDPPRYLFIFAHPDDETIGAGAAMAALVDAGADVVVLTATRGEMGDVMTSNLAYLLKDRAAYAAYREAEIAASMEVLGVRDQRFLGTPAARAASTPIHRYSDSGYRLDPGDKKPLASKDSAPDALANADLRVVAADIDAVIQDVQPDVVITENALGGSGHIDHRIVHEATMLAIRTGGPWHPLSVFTVERSATVVKQSIERVAKESTFEVDPDAMKGTIPDSLISVVIDDPDALARKKKALQRYETQMVVRGDFYGMKSGFGTEITVPETFREIGGAVYYARSGMANDFIEGWEPILDLGKGWVGTTRSGVLQTGPASRFVKIRNLVLAAIGGLLLGTAATIGHMQAVSVFGTDIPVGLILGLVSLFSVGLWIRVSSENSWPAILYGLGGALAVLLLAQTGPGGDVLMPADIYVLQGDGTLGVAENWLSIVWLYGSIIAALLPGIWPRLHRRNKVTA